MGGAVRQIAVVVAFLGTILMNTLANTLPLAGRATGDISALFPIPRGVAAWPRRGALVVAAANRARQMAGDGYGYFQSALS